MTIDNAHFVFRDDKENMPCILRGNKCQWYDACAKRKLACKAYAKYVYYGRAMGIQRANPEPTRAQFLEAEQNESVGPMVNRKEATA